MTGDADGPPTLPPFGLADGVTSLAAAFAITTALFTRTRTGRGQVIDLAIVEPLMAILGPQVTRYDQLGSVQTRNGNRSTNNAPRNIYPTADGSWVAVSTSSQSIAERVLTRVGHPEVCDESWFGAGATRAQHADELDEYVGSWIAQRSREVVIQEFTKAQAAIAPVYTAADIVAEPQFEAIGAIRRVEDPDLGPILMTGGLFRSSEGDAHIDFTGREPGADTDSVLGELGIAPDALAQLRQEGAVS